ncbi:GntR family transcriptional regulator [Candidatus Enterococcus ferrettii]|uniref:HTH gntR-type domain-containing protein n=1 Tax=Candidatus Enterococcus ferrettii TaxID=2815324 RepID=A0ABV0ESP8_9ENTE|nr:GntR family transcriptional regulator [Enterococcus sp. 665A]MBO1342406.1 GntR family transcriptional regulator [Enterococcus sp. 665A]
MEPKDKVYQFISEQLTLGKLKRKDRLTEQYLVDNLGISRTPIREALLQLASDDILEREPRKGFKIRTYTEKDVENLYQLIGVLDGKIAELTVDKLSEDDYALMKFLIDSMYSAINNELYTKYNELQHQFHELYTVKCDNGLLRKEIDSKKKMFIGKAYSRIEKEQIKELLLITNQEHEEILMMFKKGQGEKLRHFLEHTHWRLENAQYDIW